MYIRKIANQKNEVSLDDPMNTDWDGNELLLSDLLGSGPDTVADRGIEQESGKQTLLRAVEKRPARKRIMELRFG